MNYKEQNTGHVLSDDEIVELYWQRQEKAIHATDKKYGKYPYFFMFLCYFLLLLCMDIWKIQQYNRDITLKGATL